MVVSWETGTSRFPSLPYHYSRAKHRAPMSSYKMQLPSFYGCFFLLSVSFVNCKVLVSLHNGGKKLYTCWLLLLITVPLCCSLSASGDSLPNLTCSEREDHEAVHMSTHTHTLYNTECLREAGDQVWLQPHPHKTKSQGSSPRCVFSS